MRKKKFTDKELIDILRNNPSMSIKEWNDTIGSPSAQTIMYRLGRSWNKVKEMIGLEINPVGHPFVKQDEIERALLKDGFITSRDLEGKRYIIRNLSEDYDIKVMKVTKGSTHGSNKYSTSDLIDLDPSMKIFYIDEIALVEFLEEHLKIEEDMSIGKKRALSHYLSDKVSKQGLEYLKSLYL